MTTAGATRFADADKWWRETTARAVVRDEVEEPGTGLVCFGAFGFADDPGDSALVVPAYVVGRRGDRAWLTTDLRDRPGPLATRRSTRSSRRGRRRACASSTAPSTATSG